MEPYHVRRSVAAAVAWSIIAEVCRHHGGNSDLRVLELHPGGGQYDLLSVFRVQGEDGSVYDGPPKQIGAFNLLAGTIHGTQSLSENPVDWLRLWLSEPDPKSVVKGVLRALGLSSQTSLPRTNRRIFGCRLIAGLLGANIVQRRYLQARMGFTDTSGYGGGVSDDLRLFTGIFETCPTGESEMRNASECWLLLAGESKAVTGALRMDGVLSSQSLPEAGHDLFDLYTQTKCMRLVVAEAQKILSPH